MATQEKPSFQATLKAFVNANKKSAELARTCSEMAIQHYWEHGDVAYLQQFYDAMMQNYNRRVAFVQWAIAHADVELVKGLFQKDKSKTALKVSQEIKDHALSEPFWEFAPEPGLVNFTKEDLDRAIANLINRFSGGNDRYVPADDDVIVHLDDIRKKLAGTVPGVTPPGEETEEQATARASAVH